MVRWDGKGVGLVRRWDGMERGKGRGGGGGVGLVVDIPLSNSSTWSTGILPAALSRVHWVRRSVSSWSYTARIVNMVFQEGFVVQ